MANFGLGRLRLVKPRDGWPNVQAQRSASGADRILEGVALFDKAALADSARAKHMHGEADAAADGVR
jgi:tRNA/rRNA methyltransferase